MFRLFASLLFLILLAYNAGGYYTLLAYEMNQARRLQYQELSEDAFIVIKIPVALYTHVENTEFEYLEEVITYHGKTYNMVKKRVQNDTLHIYTLRNHRHEHIVAQLNDYVKAHIIAEQNSTKSNPTKKLIQSFLKDYTVPDVYALSVHKLFVYQNRSTIAVAPSEGLWATDLSISSPPPELG